jgi:methyl-accepting chemotaxis protein
LFDWEEMMKSFRLTVGRKIALGFGMLVCMLIGGAGFGVYFMSDIQSRLVVIADVNNIQAAHATTMRLAVNRAGMAVRDLLFMDNQKDAEATQASVQEAWDLYDKEEAALGALIAHQTGVEKQEQQALFDKVRQAKLALLPIAEKVVTLGMDSQSEAGGALIRTEMAPAQRAWIGALSDLGTFQAKMSAQAADEAKGKFRAAMILTVVLSAIAVSVAVGVAISITRGLLKQLGGEPEYAAEVATRIAGGDLTTEVAVRDGDSSSMLFAVKIMRARLADIVADIRQGADSIATGSTQIAAGNADLSQRTEEQASNLQQTAASMEQLKGAVSANADSAKKAAQLAQTASTSADQGNAVVARAVGAMNSINEASAKMADIIGVIDSIAFQTNILALNAAVEAARAGEQGRGFAVVASEVRNLAQRSAGAAKEIKQLIQDSIEKVADGCTQVTQAGRAMDDILISVRRVGDLMAEINAATGGQAQGIGQVSDAVSQLDDVTQQNAALVEESAAAADSLRMQADRLVQVVSVFQLAHNNAP